MEEGRSVRRRRSDSRPLEEKRQRQRQRPSVLERLVERHGHRDGHDRHDGHDHHDGHWNHWDRFGDRHYHPYHWWGWCSAPRLTTWVSFGWNEPYYWDYGPGEYIYCNNGIVYVNGTWFEPAPIFYQRTLLLAQQAPFGHRSKRPKSIGCRSACSSSPATAWPTTTSWCSSPSRKTA